MKLAKTLIGAAVGTMFAAAASAATIPLPSGFIQLSDNNAESLINANGTGCTPGGDCILGVGDRLRGQFDINSIEGLNPPTPATFTPFNGTHELTGIFDITVVSKVAGFGGQVFFQFAPTGNLSTAGAAVEMYTDPSNDYRRAGCLPTNTVANCEATATNGALWAAFGFGPGSFWTASATSDDISAIGALTPPTPGGSFQASLDFLVNNTGFTFDQKPCANPLGGPTGFPTTPLVDNSHACASGSLLGTGGVDTPYDSFSNVDFTLLRAPEPGALALLGIGFALAGMARRKRS
jgi:hypothetical protein